MLFTKEQRLGKGEFGMVYETEIATLSTLSSLLGILSACACSDAVSSTANDAAKPWAW
jgi:hypothetical protein